MEKKIAFVLYVVTILFGIFIFRLWDLQLIKGGEYKKIDESNRLRVIDIHAPRGIIHDRNDKPLVKNIPTFDISIVKEDLPKDPESLAYLGRLIGLSLDEIKHKIATTSVKPFESFKLKQNVSFKEVARVEARKVDFPGLQVDVVGGREYIYGSSSSHVIGYLGRLALKQLDDPEYMDVPRESFVGQFGVEKFYDKMLRGVAGKKVIEVDALGSIVRVARIQRPVKGEKIKLTIDIDLQRVAEKGLRGKAGAVVALNPDSGEILAMYSAPSFDPNLFLRGIDYRDWKNLTGDPRKPLLNRVVQSRYPPGSTFKIITAIAALEEGLINEDTRHYCNGAITFGRIFKCWKEGGHGEVDLHKALVESCDVFFYEVAKKLNIDTLAKYAMRFGLGSRVGVDLDGELRGIVPTSEWKFRARKEKWFTGETLNTVIGQGYLSTTPIQMAKVVATVANNGESYEPFLLKEPNTEMKTRSVIKMEPENMKMVKDALMSVVSDKHGTGRTARSNAVSIGGKTGTTQVIGGDTSREDLPEKYRDHAWFVAFAPEYNPQIAVAVFVEHGGHGSTGAAPIAKKIIEAYYRSKRGGV